MNIKGIILTILSAILFGITPIITTSIYAYGANAITTVFFRSLIVLPILFMLTKLHHVSLVIHKEELRNIGIIAIFGSGLTTILLFSSYTYIDVGTATTLHFLYPVVVSILCYFIYKEKLGKVKIIALCFAVIGTLCFFDFRKLSKAVGLLLALSSAITYAFYMVKMEKTGLSHQNAYKTSFYIAVFITLETIVYHLVVPSITFNLPIQAYGLLLLLAIVSSFLAVVLLQYGIRYLGSSTASLFCLFEPITSILCGYLFLQEEITFLKLLGCFIILTSLLLISLGEYRNRLLHKTEAMENVTNSNILS